jgi:DNA primase
MQSVVARYVDLKRAGPHLYRGLCPFHAEKTPSFTVNTRDQFFYCFGCQTGGDIFKFLQLASGKSFPEAVAELAEKAGIPVPRDAFITRDEDRVAAEKRERLRRVAARAAEFFRAKLWSPEGARVLKYLKERGVDGEVASLFNLGWSPEGWEELSRALLSEGFPREDLIEAGLAKAREGAAGGLYDVFRGRLMIPIQDADSRTVAFGGRIVGEHPPETPKYVNSPLTPIYKKGSLLFGLPQARPYLKAYGCVYIVEGYFDLISLHAHGVKNVAASLGTALTQTQVNSLRGKVREIYLFFDGDRAGREAAKKALPKLLNAEIEGRVITLPERHDPDTFVREHGMEALFALAEGARNVMDHAVDYLLDAYPGTLIGQARAVREVKELISEVPDSAKGQLLRNMFSERLGIDPELFKLSSAKAQEPRPSPPARLMDPRVQGADFLAARILRHVVIHPETAPLLKGLSLYWPEDPTLELFREFQAQIARDGQVNVRDLPPLDDPLLLLVSEAALAPRTAASEEAAAVFREYAQRLKRRGINTALSRLSVKIGRAEREGDLEALGSLLKEQRSLTEEKKSLGSPAAAGPPLFSGEGGPPPPRFNP